MITKLYFENPYALLVLLGIPLAFFLLYKSYRGDIAVLKALKHSAQPKAKYVFLGIVMVLAISSISLYSAGLRRNVYGPSPSDWGYGDYVLLVDTSRSMAASSLPNQENNLDVAKNIMMNMVNRVSPNAKYQVFGYSRLAFPLSSLVEDREELEDIINNGLHVNAIPYQGSDIANALSAVAHYKLEGGEAYSGISHLVIFSDGQLSVQDAMKMTNAISDLVRAEISVIAVGIGSITGQKIHIYDEDGNFTGKYEHLEDGRVYVSRLQEQSLRTIASSTGGSYFHHSDIDSLMEYMQSTLRKDNASSAEKEVIEKKNYDNIFLGIFTLVLCALLLRRGELY